MNKNNITELEEKDNTIMKLIEEKSELVVKNEDLEFIIKKMNEVNTIISINPQGYEVNARVDDILIIFNKVVINGKISKTRKEFHLFVFLAKSLPDDQKHVLKRVVKDNYSIELNLDFKF